MSDVGVGRYDVPMFDIERATRLLDLAAEYAAAKDAADYASSMGLPDAPGTDAGRTMEEIAQDAVDVLNA